LATASLTNAASGAWSVGPTRRQRAKQPASESSCDFFGIVTGTYGLAYLYCQRGDVAQAIRLLERGMTLCREREFSVWLPQHTGYLGYAYARAGRIDEGLALLDRALEIYDATRAWPFRALLTGT